MLENAKIALYKALHEVLHKALREALHEALREALHKVLLSRSAYRAVH